MTRLQMETTWAVPGDGCRSPTKKIQHIGEQLNPYDPPDDETASSTESVDSWIVKSLKHIAFYIIAVLFDIALLIAIGVIYWLGGVHWHTSRIGCVAALALCLCILQRTGMDQAATRVPTRETPQDQSR